MTGHKTENRSGIEKIEPTAHCFHGPRGLLICGFSIEFRSGFKGLLDRIGLKPLPVIWADNPDAERLLGDLFLQSERSVGIQDSALPRAVIAAGIEQQELHRLMSGWRQTGEPSPLWAVLTPTTEHWTLRRLLQVLIKEAKAMAAKRSKTS